LFWNGVFFKHRTHVSAVQFVCVWQKALWKGDLWEGRTMSVPPDSCVSKVTLKRNHVKAGHMSISPDLWVSKEVVLKKKHVFWDWNYVKDRTNFPPESCVSKRLPWKGIIVGNPLFVGCSTSPWFQRMVTLNPRFWRAIQGQTYVSATQFLRFKGSCFEREYLFNTGLLWVRPIRVFQRSYLEQEIFR